MKRWTKGDVLIAVVGNVLAIVLVLWSGSPLRWLLLYVNHMNSLLGLAVQAGVPLLCSAVMTVYFLKRRLGLRQPLFFLIGWTAVMLLSTVGPIFRLVCRLTGAYSEHLAFGLLYILLHCGGLLLGAGLGWLLAAGWDLLKRDRRSV